MSIPPFGLLGSQLEIVRPQRKHYHEKSRLGRHEGIIETKCKPTTKSLENKLADFQKKFPDCDLKICYEIGKSMLENLQFGSSTQRFFSVILRHSHGSR